MKVPFKKIYLFYRDGFAAMTTGRTLWKIIIIKLIILFGVVRLFFMPDVLNQHFKTDLEKADHVVSELLSVHKSVGLDREQR